VALGGSCKAGRGGSAGRRQTEVEIHATAMPRPERVTPRASGTGRARQKIPAAQFTDKGGAGLLV